MRLNALSATTKAAAATKSKITSPGGNPAAIDVRIGLGACDTVAIGGGGEEIAVGVGDVVGFTLGVGCVGVVVGFKVGCDDVVVIGVGDGVTVGIGDGVTNGVGDGVTVDGINGVIIGVGVGVGDGVISSDGDGVAVGTGFGVGEGDGDDVGVVVGEGVEFCVADSW